MKTQNKALEHIHSIKIRDEYGTRKELFEQACKDYNIHPTLDICASKANHVVPKYITKEQNCFRYDIKESFFMNPPYSKASQFMDFAYHIHKKNNLDALILVYAKTGVSWWHEFVVNKAEIHYIKGRLKFLDEKGNIPTWCKFCKKKYSGLQICPVCKKRTTENSAPYDSCWIIYRAKS